MQIIKPNPGPQTDFCRRKEFEVLFGGQAGGGKTFALLMEATRYVPFAGYKGLLLRRTFPQLQEIIDKTHQIYPALGGQWNGQQKRWNFPHGSSVRMRHLRNEIDKYDFKGDEYQYIGFDEATEFSEGQYLYLFSRCRSTNPEIPCRIRAASNPGGPSHKFFKERFRIGNMEPCTTIIDADTGLERIYIPSKISDNPYLDVNDPFYVSRLKSLPLIERRRLLEGNWDIFISQAFPELNADLHIVDDFDIPHEWPLFVAMDWGYSSPFAVVWFAIDPHSNRIYIYREWYGKDETTANSGVKMSPTEVAVGILERQSGESVQWGPADPDLFNPRWKKLSKSNTFGIVGPSPAEDMSQMGVRFMKADNNRKLGRLQVHKRLAIDKEGIPGILFFKSCTESWRTMMTLGENSRDPEDVASENVEDHIYSCIRYFCMFKPCIAKPIKSDPTHDSFKRDRERFMKASRMARMTGMGIEEAYKRTK